MVVEWASVLRLPELQELLLIVVLCLHLSAADVEWLPVLNLRVQVNRVIAALQLPVPAAALELE